MATPAHAFAGQREDVGVEREYDLFLSTPMSGLGDDRAYQHHRTFVLEVLDALKSHPTLERIYFAGLNVDSIQGFDAGDEALLADTLALRQSRLFCMVYPAKIASSVLLEAGMALAWGKPCTFFVRRREDLPYLLQHPERVADHDEFPPMRIICYEDEQKLLRRLEREGPELLINGRSASGWRP